MDAAKIGERLKELRGSRSQKEVADACGVTDMAISLYESGERIPRDEIKRKWHLTKSVRRSGSVAEKRRP